MMMIHARRPGHRLVERIDRRSDGERQQDRLNAMEIHEGLEALNHGGEAVEARCAAAREGFKSLTGIEQDYIKSVVHLSPRLYLLVTTGEWLKASKVLANIASFTPDPVRSHELAIRLALFAENWLEDKILLTAAA